MGEWGSENFGTKSFAVDLEALVAEFPSSLKQAMYAAANKGTIMRGTWNHCALNAAGEELSQKVSSTQQASKAFGITNAQAGHFIRLWDSRTGTDEECTEFLKEIILKAGLFVEPGERLPRIIKRRVYESQETKLREQFEKLMELNAVPDTDVAMEMLFADPGELVSA